MANYNSNWRREFPELDRFLRRLQKAPKTIWVYAGIALFLVVTAATSYYTVQPDEEAVVLRLGRHNRTTLPGLHFKLPFGIEQAIKVKTKLVLQEEFGFRTQDVSGKRTQFSEQGYSDEAIMLTGDLNVANVEWITQFQIEDPKKFLFHTREPVENVRDISEAIMRRVVGDRLVSEVLTVGRTEVAKEAAELTQKVLRRYDMGVEIVSVKLQDVNPPEKVKAAFNEVNEAKQEQEKLVNQAEREYNKVIPKSRGNAKRKIEDAKGYAKALVNQAQGDAKRFNARLKEYRKAPKVTRQRMYLETLEKIFSRMENMTIVDSEVKGLMPVFGKKGITGTGSSKGSGK